MILRNIIPPELASVRPFFHTNTNHFMSFQGKNKGHVFQKQALRPLIFVVFMQKVIDFFLFGQGQGSSQGQFSMFIIMNYCNK